MGEVWSTGRSRLPSICRVRIAEAEDSWEGSHWEPMGQGRRESWVQRDKCRKREKTSTQ